MNPQPNLVHATDLQERSNLWDRMAERGHDRTIAKTTVLGAPYGMPLDTPARASAWRDFCFLIGQEPHFLRGPWQAVAMVDGSMRGFCPNLVTGDDADG